MSTTIITVGALAAIGAGSTLALFTILKKARSSVSDESSVDFDVVEETNRKLDGAMERAFERAESMVPLHEASELEHSLTELERKLSEEQNRLSGLEAKLQDAQTAVDQKEAKHNELKLGKEDSLRLAEEIRSNKERLVAEADSLSRQLADTKTQVNSLGGEIDLKEEDKKIFNQMETSLVQSEEQLKDLVGLHKQSSERFLTLEAQYQQLEKEYRNLVEQQLSGEG